MSPFVEMSSSELVVLNIHRARPQHVNWLTSIDASFGYLLRRCIHATRSEMAALARSLSRALGYNLDVEVLKVVVIFAAIGLVASMMVAAYGLDLSQGF
jgi:hypothetical protein